MDVKKISVSVVMPMRNSSTTVFQSLKSVNMQSYPIREILVVDNASLDNSVLMVKHFAKKSKVPIRVIARKENGGVGSSFNLGVKKTRSSLVVLMHSDCFLPSKKELDKLIKPLLEDASVVATFPTIELPLKVWESYSFWEKCFFSRMVGKGYAGPTAKFDCVRRNIYLKAGGFDTVNFGIGGEDMDLAKKIGGLGKFVLSKAHAVHLHYLGEGYTFRSFLRKKRQYAMIYGRLLRQRPHLFFGKSIILLLKPALAILPFLPGIHIITIPILLLYSFLFTKNMFVAKSTLMDSRVLILPFVNLFLVYFETYWIIRSFLFGKNTVLS